MDLRQRLFKAGPEPEFFELPEGATNILPSDDAARVAYVTSDKKTSRVEINGRRQRAYEEVRALVFAPDSHAVAYAALHKRGWTVVFDENEHEPWLEIGASSPVVSPDSVHVAYTARKDEGWYAVLDGRVVDGPFERFLDGGIVFSPDSRRLIYAVHKEQMEYVIVDGIEREGFRGIIPRSWTFGPDSDTVAYGVCLDGEWVEQAFVGQTAIMFNRELQRKWRHDGRTLSDRLGDEIYFSPDGKRMAYAVTQAGQTAVILDGVPQRPGDGGLVSGWDRSEVSETTRASWKAGSIVFSPDSQHVAFAVADRGQNLVIVDGVEKARHKSLVRQSILFTPDSLHLAYGVKHGVREFLMRDTKPTESFDSLAPVRWSFSPDSSHLVWMGLNGSQYQLALDWNSRLFPGVPLANTPIVWDGPENFHFLTIHGRRVSISRHGLF